MTASPSAVAPAPPLAWCSCKALQSPKHIYTAYFIHYITQIIYYFIHYTILCICIYIRVLYHIPTCKINCNHKRLVRDIWRHQWLVHLDSLAVQLNQVCFYWVPYIGCAQTSHHVEVGRLWTANRWKFFPCPRLRNHSRESAILFGNLPSQSDTFAELRPKTKLNS